MGISPYLARLREEVGHALLVIPSATVLPFDPAGRVLLVRESDAGTWATIGGAVEPDESPAEAAIREAREEAGVEVELLGIRAALGGPLFRMRYPNGDEAAYVVTVFDARVASGVARPDHDETVEIGWFSPGDLPTSQMSAFTRALLQGARLLPR